MHKTKEIIAILVIVVIAGMILYPRFKTVSPTPIKNSTATESIMFDPTLKDVDFCGNKYQTRDVAIEGVNIVERISQIANEKYYKEFSAALDLKNRPDYYNNPGLNICANILSAKNTSTSKQTLEINNSEALLKGTKINETGKTVYSIRIESDLYSVTTPDNTVGLMNGYDGSYNYLGRLK